MLWSGLGSCTEVKTGVRTGIRTGQSHPMGSGLQCDEVTTLTRIQGCLHCCWGPALGSCAVCPCTSCMAPVALSCRCCARSSGTAPLADRQCARWHNGSPYMLCAILHTYSGHAVNGVALGVAFVVIVCDRLQCCAVEACVVMQTAAVPQASKGDKQGHLLLTVAAHAMLVCCSEVLPLMLDPKQWFSWVTVTHGQCPWIP